MSNTYIYPGAILELNHIINRCDPLSIFLVTGKKSYEKCGAKEKINTICKNYNITHFNDFQTNTDSKDVIKGIKLFNESKSDLIISIGGGSSIDMAKLINYYYNASIETITNKNIKNAKFSPITHICIPTTAGSGSEATHFAVMYIGDTKYSIADQRLVPNYSIIDPEFHYSQTPYQKAVSGVDALAQSIESFWSNQSTKESKMYSEQALKLVWENLPKVVHEGTQLAHLNLAIGAHLAGKAINIAKTTAPHAFSYIITKKLGLPHGHAIALLLPFFTRLNKNITLSNCNDTRGIIYVKKQMKKIGNILHSDENNIEYTIVDFFDIINLNIKLNELHLSNEEFKTIFKNINYERLINNPVKIENQTLENMFTKIFHFSK